MNMKTIKRILVTACGLAMLALSAQAQYPTFGPNPSGWTGFTCPGSSATNLNWVIDVSKQASVGVMLSAQGNTNGVMLGYFVYARSVGGTTYETASSSVGITAPTDYSKLSVLTNLPSYGAQFIKVLYFTNAS